MRIAVITDLHAGKEVVSTDLPHRISHQAEKEADSFLESASGADVIIQLGDLIQRNDYEQNTADYQGMLRRFKIASCPVYHAIGNHEQAFLGEEDLRAWLGYDHLFYAFPCGDYTGLVLYAEQRTGIFPRIGKTQLEWLKKELAASQKPVLVFMHHPLADQSLVGNRWFESQPEQCLVENRAEVRGLLEASGKVRAVINGHAHWNNLTIQDGIPYVTLQSAVEDLGDGVPASSWAALDVEDGHLKWEVYGRQPLRVSL